MNAFLLPSEEPYEDTTLQQMQNKLLAVPTVKYTFTIQMQFICCQVLLRNGLVHFFVLKKHLQTIEVTVGIIIFSCDKRFYS